MQQPISQQEISPWLEKIERMTEAIASVVRGKEEVIRLAQISLFSGGHILLEDIPGVGKTIMALALARSVDVSFKRVQFTNDTLPGDILGFSVFNQKTGEFEFRKGPIFSGILLSDEINRTSPKSQSALLEAMTERKVTVDNDTYTLPQPFMVIATQNPTDHFGTFALPDSQLDRFMVRTQMGYPAPEYERQILKEHIELKDADKIEPVMTEEDVLGIQQAVAQVHIEDSLMEYLLALISATRAHSQITQGVSPRGALMLKRAAQAAAFLEGRAFAVPDDIQAMVAPVLAHRIIVAGQGRGGVAEKKVAEAIIGEILEEIPVPV